MLGPRGKFSTLVYILSRLFPLFAFSLGCLQEHFAGVDLGTDPSGNKKLPDIGHFLKDRVKDWFQGARTRGGCDGAGFSVRAAPLGSIRVEDCFQGTHARSVWVWVCGCVGVWVCVFPPCTRQTGLKPDGM